MNFKKILMKIKNKILSLVYSYNWILAIKIDENNWKYIDNELNRFEADPFVVKEKEKYYIFYEDMKKNENGTIYVGEIDPKNMNLTNKREVLKENFHLSYPNVFKIDEKYYMIPETHQANKIFLYEAVEFPNKWKIKRVLLDNMSCVDTTILKKGGIWYFFFSPCGDKNKKPHMPYCSSLNCYYTENLFEEELKPIENKLVSESIETSRMGGNFLRKNEENYRFSQDCKNIYGETLNVHRVRSISTELYEEEFIKKLKKPKNTLGMHTYSKIDEIEVIDVYVKQLKFFKKNWNEKNSVFKFKLDI